MKRIGKWSGDQRFRVGAEYNFVDLGNVRVIAVATEHLYVVLI